MHTCILACNVSQIHAGTLLYIQRLQYFTSCHTPVNSSTPSTTNSASHTHHLHTVGPSAPSTNSRSLKSTSPTTSKPHHTTPPLGPTYIHTQVSGVVHTPLDTPACDTTSHLSVHTFCIYKMVAPPRIPTPRLPHSLQSFACMHYACIQAGITAPLRTRSVTTHHALHACMTFVQACKPA